MHSATEDTVTRSFFDSWGFKRVSIQNVKFVTFASAKNKILLASCTYKWTSPILNILAASKP
jgi:hypothetical protein